MDTSVSGSEPHPAGEIGRRSLKVNKACVPCRARKVKCDSAVIGLPCSSCTSRQRAEDCVLPVRKGRTRKLIHGLPTPGHTTGIPATPMSIDGQLDSLNPINKSRKSSSSDPLDRQSPRHKDPDLLYLNILNDAVKEGTESESNRHHTTSITEDSLTPRNCLWNKLPQSDGIDNEYLAKKGVFDLPPPPHLDALIKTYFDYVYPCAPVISRADFIRGYQSGDCSLFLLRAILTPASLHAPTEVLSACGFDSRSAAQESFFSKAKLLHDFVTEDDPLLRLQGCIIMCLVILDHPSDRDFSYWFHESIRLATKLDIRDKCIREVKPRKVLKLYRRIWWALYAFDIFHVFVNLRRSRLLEDTPAIKPRTEDDWEAEDVLEHRGATSRFLSAVTPQQKASPVVQCELSRISGKCFSILTNQPQQDPRQLLHPLDAWRKSLAAKMHVGGNTGTDIYYLNIQALSYRFECILCRLIRRRWQQSCHADWSEWAKERFRLAVLELDTIAMRVLASGTLQDFPISFVTTITALLALHIESALDPAETDLAHSMARISISQSMLVLTQGKEMPALKRALPIFEEILAKKNLYAAPPNILGQVASQSQSQSNSMADDGYPSTQTQASVVSSEFEQYGNNPSFDVDFLGFDFLGEWQSGQMDFSGQY